MRDREVALFGLGGSGMATAEALRAGGATPIVWDDNPDSVERARSNGFTASDLREVDWSRFAALVLAPGVPLSHPKPHWTVELARAAEVEVIGDVELFCRERDAVRPETPFVAITGTNGKSTTTALIAYILREQRIDVQMGGNIGVPILSLEPFDDDRIYVIECSSYQIDLAPSLNPSVGVLLNITPDHLDRHGSFENYVAIKERLVAASELAVVGVDDEPTVRIAARLETIHERAARLSTISGKPMGDLSRATTTGEASVVSRAGHPHFVVGPLDIPSLRGGHNAQNAAAAFAVAGGLGVNAAKVGEALKTFPGLPHRMEPVRSPNGLTVVNDSKATNADAAAPALSAFDHVYWIAGGLPKDGGIEPLRPLFDRVARAYLIGEAAPQFAATLGDTVPYEISATVDVAVAHAARDAKAAGGGVILFSPAAASFDQFRNFEERGEAFRAAVRALED